MFILTEHRCFAWPPDACCLALVPGFSHKEMRPRVMKWIGLEDTTQPLPCLHHCWERGKDLQITSLCIHFFFPLNSCLVLLCPLAQTTSMSPFSFRQLALELGTQWVSLGLCSQIHTRYEINAWRWHGDIFIFTVHRDAYLHCVLTVIMCCTYRKEEHAVHPKRGVTRVEGQSGEEKKILFNVSHKILKETYCVYS